MENLYVWLIIFSGAMIGLLGTLLLASEREIRNKRQECEWLRRNQTASSRDRSSEGQGSKTHPSGELTTRNSELLEKNDSLSSQLAASQRTVEEFQTIRDRLDSTDSENQQLRVANQELRRQLAGIQ